MGVRQASWGWRKSLPIAGKSSLAFRSDSVRGGDNSLSRLLKGKIGSLEKKLKAMVPVLKGTVGKKGTGY